MSLTDPRLKEGAYIRRKDGLDLWCVLERERIDERATHRYLLENVVGRPVTIDDRTTYYHDIEIVDCNTILQEFVIEREAAPPILIEGVAA